MEERPRDDRPQDEVEAPTHTSGPVPARAPTRRGRVSDRLRTASLDLGEVLSTTFATFGRLLVPLVLLSWIFYAPFVLYVLGAVEAAWHEIPRSEMLGGLRLDADDVVAFSAGVGDNLIRFLDIAHGLLLALLQGMVVYAVFRKLKHQSPHLAASFKMGLRRFLPVLGVGLVTGIAVGGILFATALLAMGAGGSTDFGAFAVIAFLIGGTLSLMVLSAWYVAVPATVVEETGVAKSIARSATLTRGTRFKVFVAVLVVMGLQFAWDRLAYAVIFANPQTFDEFRVAYVVTNAVDAPFLALGAVLATTMYHNLRRSREGVDVDELLEVFD